MELRKEELIKLRGDGKRENKEWERIYEYDYYDELSRHELGESSSHPYPRRGRTVQHPNSGTQNSSLSHFSSFHTRFT